MLLLASMEGAGLPKEGWAHLGLGEEWVRHCPTVCPSWCSPGLLLVGGLGVGGLGVGGLGE